ncbi:hypothetical protein BUZ94_13070 [Mammaliicoccus sciuri]|uniref:hypothetical protein n=1 Tax=Mammaliicoccus sciuri TaxID=1296 RepID=UPI000E6A840F|nr:hypothetical protein [Mammaliicoccus sciuri]RIO07389.1 hypothetical protein BUZ94_13070 [Mammaliicoccus sciuri]
MINITENFLDGVLLTLFIYLLITVIWQWIEKKVKGERTYIIWHDVVAIVFSVVLAIALMLFQDVLIVLLVIALINITAQIVILIMIWNAVAELIALRKVDELLKQQLESKDRQIEMLEKFIQKQ